jgi:hypothetical protein
MESTSALRTESEHAGLEDIGGSTGAESERFNIFAV